MFQKLCRHVDTANVEGFNDAIKDYGIISRLDQWHHFLFSSITNNMGASVASTNQTVRTVQNVCVSCKKLSKTCLKEVVFLLKKILFSISE